MEAQAPAPVVVLEDNSSSHDNSNPLHSIVSDSEASERENREYEDSGTNPISFTGLSMGISESGENNNGSQRGSRRRSHGALSDSLDTRGGAASSMLRGPGGEKLKKASRDRKASLALVVLATVIAVVAGVLTGLIIFLFSVNQLEVSAQSKGEAVMNGAIGQVRFLQTSMEEKTNSLRLYALSVAQTVDFANASATREFFNESLFYEWNADLQSNTALYGWGIRVLYPRIPDNITDLPENDRAFQSGCYDTCARPGIDPTYSGTQAFGVWYDLLRNGSRDYVYEIGVDGSATSDRGEVYRIRNDVQVLEGTERQTITFRHAEKLYDYNSLTSNINGSLLDGQWNPVRLWGALDGSFYYYLRYSTMFLEPRSRVSISVVSWDVLTNWYKALIAVINVSEQELLMMTNGATGELLAFSGDEFGDERLRSCSQDLNSAEDLGGKCDDLRASTHRHWWPRSVYGSFTSELATISEPSVFSDWTDFEESPESSKAYLVIIREVWNKDRLRVVASYAIHRRKALGNLQDQSLVTVILATLIILLASSLLAAIGVIAINKTHETVDVAAILAVKIAHYDVDGAEKSLEEKSTGNELLNDYFKKIIGNLRAYRPFLPRALMQQNNTDQGDHYGGAASLTTFDALDDQDFAEADPQDDPLHHHHHSSSYGNGGVHPNSQPGTMPHSTNNSAAENPHHQEVFAILGHPEDNHQATATTEESKRSQLLNLEAEGEKPAFDSDDEQGGRDTSSNRSESLSDRVGGAFSLNRLKSQRFKSQRGTVMVIDWDNLPTHEVGTATRLIKLFLNLIMKQISRCGGVVDVLQANRLLVTFNYHSPVLKHAEEACRCANRVRARVSEDAKAKHMNVVIAITSGFNLVGTCGTEEQKSRVVVGEGVDLAYRLPSLQRALGCAIIVTEAVAKASPYFSLAVDYIRPSWHQPQRTKAVTLYELFPERNKKASSSSHPLTRVFQKLRQNKYDAATEDLDKILEDDTSEHFDNFHLQRLRVILDTNYLKWQQSDLGYGRREINWEPLEGPIFAQLAAEQLQGGENQSRSSGAKALHSSVSSGSISDVRDALKMKNKLEAAKHQAEEEESKKVLVEKEQTADGGGMLFSMFVMDESVNGSVNPEGQPSNATQNGASTASEEAQSHSNNLNGGTVTAITTAEPTGILPAEFVDVTGEKWMRTKSSIGAGQYGEVFVAMSTTGLLAAVKAFNISKALTIDVESLVNEVKILSEYRHEHIAGYVSCGLHQESGNFLILMEYMSAGSLKKMLNEVGGKMPAMAIQHYLADVLRGLCYLHEQGVTHCDLKPDNVLLTGDGTAKLADFGTASFEGSDNGKIRGTPRYMAPEAALGSYQSSGDIYSLGLIIIELATGKPAWHKVKGDDTSFLITLTTDLSMVPFALTAEAADLVDKDGGALYMDPLLKAMALDCCQRDPKQRPTAPELLEKLSCW